jgi:integrase
LKFVFDFASAISVALHNQRLQAKYVGNIWLSGEKHMAQARTLKEKELKQLLSHITLYRHVLRNRVMLLMTHQAGMRVGEVAALRYFDVMAADGTIVPEIRLSADQTKGSRSRIVYLPEKLRKELLNYVRTYLRGLWRCIQYRLCILVAQ